MEKHFRSILSGEALEKILKECLRLALTTPATDLPPRVKVYGHLPDMNIIQVTSVYWFLCTYL